MDNKRNIFLRMWDIISGIFQEEDANDDAGYIFELISHLIRVHLCKSVAILVFLALMRQTVHPPPPADHSG